MTAEEIFEKYWKFKTDHPIDDVIKINMQSCKDAMIEFATYHVELALKDPNINQENCYCKGDYCCPAYIPNLEIKKYIEKIK